MKYPYKYAQAVYPREQTRTRLDLEYELIDTDVFGRPEISKRRLLKKRAA